jgi:predicted deacetylase
MKSLITIHDVVPETLDDILKIIVTMDSFGLPPAPILVSPGCEWTNGQIQTLQKLTEKGHEPVGHGWIHHVQNIRGLRHRIHAILLSRNAAEHLALSADQLEDMLHRCHAWFPEHDLPAPTMYVPPAWGLGKLPRKTMRRLSFRYYETLNGIYDSQTNTFTRLPLVGFEADTRARAVGLTLFNAANITLARLTRKPLRIAIHPKDLELRLGGELRKLLERLGQMSPI